MTLQGGEFIRRFLVHLLPNGFHRIRYYGFLGNCHRAQTAPTWFSRGDARSCGQACCRPPAQPTRIVLDGSEHGTRLECELLDYHRSIRPRRGAQRSRSSKASTISDVTIHRSSPIDYEPGVSRRLSIPTHIRLPSCSRPSRGRRDELYPPRRSTTAVTRAVPVGQGREHQPRLGG
jgi:hypothetical protein